MLSATFSASGFFAPRAAADGHTDASGGACAVGHAMSWLLGKAAQMVYEHVLLIWLFATQVHMRYALQRQMPHQYARLTEGGAPQMFV